MAQGDGTHGPTRIARDGLLSGNLCLDAHSYRLDGVDSRNSIGPSLHTCSGRFGNMGDVGCHLRNDGYLDAALDTSGKSPDQLRALPHVATHALMLHLRTREVQLHGVAASLLSHLGQRHPLLFGLSHNRGYHHLRWIVLLQSAQNVEVHRHRILAQLFHVTEAIEVAMNGNTVHRIETRRHLLDFLHANGLVEDTCPAGIEGARHHLVVGADGRRGEKERILAWDAAEVNIKLRVMAVVYIIRMDATQHFLDAEGPVIVNTRLFCPFQISIGTVLHPL